MQLARGCRVVSLVVVARLSSFARPDSRGRLSLHECRGRGCLDLDVDSPHMSTYIFAVLRY